MHIYMLVNTGKPAAWEVAQQAAKILRDSNAFVQIEEHVAGEGGRGFAEITTEAERQYKACDIVLSVGGDGTMLHAARHSMIYQKPLLGINIGRVGFLTIVESDELHKLKRLANGDYCVSLRKMLCANISGSEPCEHLALNDVVLFKESPDRMLSLDVFCDDVLISRFRGDGVIFSTPTGSTAYSLSAGGPILDAQLNGIVVTQICAHIVHTPPLVVAAHRVLKAVCTGDKDEQMHITCDGRQSMLLKRGEIVHITQSHLTVPMVQFGEVEQLEAIDKKLKGR